MSEIFRIGDIVTVRPDKSVDNGTYKSLQPGVLFRVTELTTSQGVHFIRVIPVDETYHPEIPWKEGDFFPIRFQLYTGETTKFLTFKKLCQNTK